MLKGSIKTNPYCNQFFSFLLAVLFFWVSFTTCALDFLASSSFLNVSSDMPERVLSALVEESWRKALAVRPMVESWENAIPKEKKIKLNKARRRKSRSLVFKTSIKEGRE